MPPRARRALAALCAVDVVLGLLALGVVDPERGTVDDSAAASPSTPSTSSWSAPAAPPPADDDLPPRAPAPGALRDAGSTPAVPVDRAPVPEAPIPPPPMSIPEQPPVTRAATVDELYLALVPPAWRGAVPATFVRVPGDTSRAYVSGVIEISDAHAHSSTDYLAVVLTHEWGHLVAYAYGTREYPGAPPAGWPRATDLPEEHFADCVQQVLTRSVDPSHGLPPCGGDQLAWTEAYLAAGPAPR